ncbi:MAG: hypothetical protein GY835_01585 [bacterium]|nr:hypothetical protein [bacterium]
MVFRKDLNKRSPLRVFERSLHGGLGKGNIGVVTARKGVGKTAFLAGVALDDVLRGRKVLHATLRRSVQQVTTFYDEIFNELTKAEKAEDVSDYRLEMIKNRHILSYADGDFSVDRIRESLDFLSEHAEFQPDAVILNGYPDFEGDSEGLPKVMQELKDLAQERQVELWINALRHREGQEKDERDVPLNVARCDEFISVIVRLEPKSTYVKLRLVKDHENAELAELHIQLDPKTLLLRWV